MSGWGKFHSFVLHLWISSSLMSNASESLFETDFLHSGVECEGELLSWVVSDIP